jgi:hypothetical protein
MTAQEVHPQATYVPSDFRRGSAVLERSDVSGAGRRLGLLSDDRHAGQPQVHRAMEGCVSTGSLNPVTFQIILHEGSNRILFQYQNVNLGDVNPTSNGGRATIGIRNTGALTNQQQIDGDELSVEGTNVGGNAPFGTGCLLETVDSL